MIHLGVMIVQEGSFAMANMQVSRWFRRKSGYNFSIDSILENTIISSILLVKIKDRREDLTFNEVYSLFHIFRFEINLI